MYLLHGEESYFIDLIADMIESTVLTDEEKSFNQSILYGKDTEVKQIVDEARQYPMMAEYRLVFVKEAQDLKGIEQLEQYTKSPSPLSIVVLCHKHKKVNGRLKWFKNISEKGVVFESKKLYDSQIPAWIEQYLNAKGLSVDHESKLLLTEYLGNDLPKISNELDKLAINLDAKGKVTADVVREQIGISKDYNVFEFQKALGEGNREKVFRMIKYFGGNESAHPLVLILGNLYSYFTKLFIVSQNMKEADAQLQKILGLPTPYFVKEYKSSAQKMGTLKIKKALQLLKKADLESKGFESRNKDSEAILSEFVIQLYS
ncbi:MAG TPA: DNA polymerase III subunit delta [Saprospiraceae bacterium]|nr:DNA polymerase III subunit delta [Saprospiraceae bacterium]